MEIDLSTMTLAAKMEISRILLRTEERLIGTHGPFFIIHAILNAYFVEWDWS